MNAVNQYPYGPLPAQIKDELVRLSQIAERKRESYRGDSAGNPSETIDWDFYGKVLAERRRRESEAR